MNDRPKKWRRLNPYVCRACGNKRFSLKYSRAVDGLCTPCRRSEQVEGQQALLFDDCKSIEFGGNKIEFQEA